MSTSRATSTPLCPRCGEVGEQVRSRETARPYFCGDCTMVYSGTPHEWAAYARERDAAGVTPAIPTLL